jgi:6-phosphofructokinase 1
MTALQGTDILMVPLADAVETLKTVPADRYEEAECVL